MVRKLLFSPAKVGNLISSSSSFSKPSLDIWKFLVHIMLKPTIQDFQHDLTLLAWEMSAIIRWLGHSCFPSSSEVKVSACDVGDPGLIPGLGRSPGEGNGNPLQYSCLENPMDRGAWWAIVHGVPKSRTRLSDFTFFHFLFLGIGLRIDLFQSCGHCWVFKIC